MPALRKQSSDRAGNSVREESQPAQMRGQVQGSQGTAVRMLLQRSKPRISCIGHTNARREKPYVFPRSPFRLREMIGKILKWRLCFHERERRPDSSKQVSRVAGLGEQFKVVSLFPASWSKSAVCALECTQRPSFPLAPSTSTSLFRARIRKVCGSCFPPHSDTSHCLQN
jgi:hypothetical protein